MAHSVEWYEKPGQLSKVSQTLDSPTWPDLPAQIPFDEGVIPEDERIPRFTSATWKYDSGAVGHLEHGVALQGTEFSTELAVFADGYQLKLVDPCE
jgi:hypothetical protein